MALGHSIILTDIYVHSIAMISFAGPSHCRIDDMLHMSKLFRHSHDLDCHGHTTCRTFHLVIINQSLIESVFTSGFKFQASQYPDM